MNLRNRVKICRKQKSIGQLELAEKVGVTRQTIGLIESGNYNPTLKLCIDISKALSSTLNDLFWIDDSDILKTYDYLIITDIGSTTTKALLIENKEGKLKFIAEVDTSTTVESPLSDVKIGLNVAVSKLQEESGVSLLTTGGKFKVPFITTSSAGGGLQILVFGLTPWDTTTLAQATAYNAGGVILHSFSLGDKISDIEKMSMIENSRPDIILMAGGTDGGNINGILRLAELLSLARPKPKYDEKRKIPLVFCGNIEARSLIQEILGENFEIKCVDNIRPNQNDINLGPARDAVLDLFMENVMERAPGYAAVKKSVEVKILPTPVAVSEILKAYGERNKVNAVLADIGGATTDIFSNISGYYNRSVAANTGLSYSIGNILKESGIKKLKKYLPESYLESEIRNYISNKMLNPNYIPISESEKLLEMVIAHQGLSLAWKQHLEMCYKIKEVGYLDKFKHKNSDLDPFEFVYFNHMDNKAFQLSDFDMIIGAGSVFSHLKSKKEVMWILTEGFMPIGVTKLAYDKKFKSPHMGILASLDKEMAIETFENECIEDAGYIVAPTGKMNPKNEVITLKNIKSGETIKVKGGDVLYYDRGGDFEVSSSKNIYLGGKVTHHKLKTELPIIIDCRGREEHFNGIPLIKYEKGPFFLGSLNFASKALPKRNSEIQKNCKYHFKRMLPYKGEILVKEGDHVTPSSEIAVNRFHPPKLYIFDVKDRVNIEGTNLTSEEIFNGIKCKAGDVIKKHDVIYDVPKQSLFTAGYQITSSVAGIVLQIEKNGMIVLREIQDYVTRPVKVDIAGPMGIYPKDIKFYLQVEIGDYVESDQILAKNDKEQLYVKSIRPGYVKDIDEKKGHIITQYDVKPFFKEAFISGSVTKVYEDLGVEIESVVNSFNGAIGFGPEVFGELEYIDKNTTGKIAYSNNPIDIKILKSLVDRGTKGIIAPSISGNDIVTFLDHEIGVGMTGSEKLPLSIIITEGFGKFELPCNYKEFFESSIGKMTSIMPMTQIRAPVVRPKVYVISEQ